MVELCPPSSRLNGADMATNCLFFTNIEYVCVLYRHEYCFVATPKTVPGIQSHSLVVLSVDILVNGAQADLSGKDKDLNTPLHLAIRKVCNNGLQMLLLPAVTIVARPQKICPPGS